MTCYFKHLEAVFKRAGIEVTNQNKKSIDKVVRMIVGVSDGTCSQIWKEVKRRISEDETGFISALAVAWRETGTGRDNT